MTTIATINAIWGHLRSTAQCQTATTEELAVCDALIARLPDEQAEAARHYLSGAVEVGALIDLTPLVETPDAAKALDARKYQDMPFCWWDFASADGGEVDTADGARRSLEWLAELHNDLAAAVADGVTCVATPAEDDDEADRAYWRAAQAQIQWTYPAGCERHERVAGELADALAWKLAEEIMRSGDDEAAHLSLLRWMRDDHAKGLDLMRERWGRTGEDMVKRAEVLVEELIDEWEEAADAD